MHICLAANLVLLHVCRFIRVSRLCDVTLIDAAAATCGHTRAQGGRTALMCAAEKRHMDCVRLLLDAGADTNVKTKVR